jgi:hypothetical protein
MPTENRSSNTKTVSVPPYIGLEPLVGRYYPAQCRRCGWVGSSEELTEDDAQCTRDIGDRLCLGDCDELERHNLLNIIQAMAAPQPHPEPIAWMVGTAFWWTKEEAERDAAATGKPVTPFGPMTCIKPAEQPPGEPVGEVVAFGEGLHEIAWAAGRMPKLGAKLFTRADPNVRWEAVAGEQMKVIEQLRSELGEAKGEYDRSANKVAALCAQLTERDAVLRDKSGDLISMAANLISAPLFALQDLQDEDKKMTRARVDHAVDVADARLKDAAYELRRIADALSASAAPIQPAAPYPNRLCHIDYTAHPHRCGCLKGDEEAQRRYDEHFRGTSAKPEAT